MLFVKNIIRTTLKNAGLSIKRIPPVSSGSHNNLYDFFEENPAESETFMQYVYSLLVKKGDIVLDIGANHGLHTIPLSRIVGEQGRVIAVEAIKGLIPDIKSKLLLNNATLINAAITKPEVVAKNKSITFTHFPNLDAFSGLKRQAETQHENGVEVKVAAKTIDQVVNEAKLAPKSTLSFIKIDVEGGDFDALLGAEQTLKKYKPVLIMENKGQQSADLYGYTKDQFFKYVESLGYTMFQFTGGSFTKKDWGGEKVYWETWLVHKDSDKLGFFKSHCESLAKTFMEDKSSLG